MEVIFCCIIIISNHISIKSTNESSKAKEFKRFHRQKCKHIPLEELQVYARLGLMNAIRNYKGKSLFSKYANIYIQGQLYRGMTELHPLTIASPRDRKNKTLSSTKQKYMLATYFFGNKEWMIDKIQYSKNNDVNDVLNKHVVKEEFYNIINQSNIQTQRMIRYKFDYEWNQLRTNKQVAELMACSEEHVRKTMKNIVLQ
jgi:RNA polymerase sigma factor (sigma-70 family)